MLIPYERIENSEGFITFKKINPTGRYKFEINPDFNEEKIFIEHRGLLFNKWIMEDFIDFRYETKVEIKNCLK